MESANISRIFSYKGKDVVTAKTVSKRERMSGYLQRPEMDEVHGQGKGNGRDYLKHEVHTYAPVVQNGKY